jgi:hypothetical protein
LLGGLGTFGWLARRPKPDIQAENCQQKRS